MYERFCKLHKSSRSYETRHPGIPCRDDEFLLASATAPCLALPPASVQSFVVKINYLVRRLIPNSRPYSPDIETDNPKFLTGRCYSAYSSQYQHRLL